MKLSVILLAGFLIVSLMLLAPLAAIWSLNTLFPQLNIDYNIWTWLATLLLVLLFRPTVNIKKP